MIKRFCSERLRHEGRLPVSIIYDRNVLVTALEIANWNPVTNIEIKYTGTFSRWSWTRISEINSTAIPETYFGPRGVDSFQLRLGFDNPMIKVFSETLYLQF